MLDLLERWDTALFYFINGRMHNSFFDVVFRFLTDLNQIRPVVWLALGALLWMILQSDRRLRVAGVVLLATVLLSDQLSSKVIKFLFERVRPCDALLDVRLLVGCGSGFSFPSSHAVNNFAGATVLAYYFPKTTWWWLTFAALVAFSRVYVGVHYPSDVVGGAIIGIMIAFVVIALVEWIELRWFPKKPAAN